MHLKRGRHSAGGTRTAEVQVRGGPGGLHGRRGCRGGQARRQRRPDKPHGEGVEGVLSVVCNFTKAFWLQNVDVVSVFEVDTKSCTLVYIIHPLISDSST